MNAWDDMNELKRAVKVVDVFHDRQRPVGFKDVKLACGQKEMLDVVC